MSINADKAARTRIEGVEVLCSAGLRGTNTRLCAFDADPSCITSHGRPLLPSHHRDEPTRKAVPSPMLLLHNAASHHGANEFQWRLR